MTTVTVAPARSRTAPPAIRRPPTLTAWATLTRRRIALSARTPREVLAPLATPILFALVIAPALAKIIPTVNRSGVDYRSFVIIGTIGLLIPLTCSFAGIGVIVDRISGARRELLAAPISRTVIVTGNLAVAVLTSLLQIAVLMLAGLARGTKFHATGTGLMWFVLASIGFTIFAYSTAEILANRIPTQEEYIGLTPVVAIVPWFLAGSLFPITAMPVGLAWIARFLPTTHVLALIRYGLLDRRATGLHAIWGVSSSTTAATLSLLVIAAWALLFSSLSIRIFKRAAVS
jgi:ABC-2 type transport system permease protein